MEEKNVDKASVYGIFERGMGLLNKVGPQRPKKSAEDRRDPQYDPEYEQDHGSESSEPTDERSARQEALAEMEDLSNGIDQRSQGGGSGGV